ncbi:TPA: enoyl-CoA hydratase/isomerase family protein [Pseudomonas aeruginosa]|nr:enoyl-CoA hydratase/isomerase family protein [Pseudomonas aeruginosa]
MTIKLKHPAAGIVQVVLDNPARSNALTYEMFERLAALWPKLEADTLVRVVVLSGSGSDAFCSGADLSANLADIPGVDELVARALLKSALFTKPIIAAITGHCVAGGLELALAADIRIISEDAKIGLPEVRWGIVPSGGAAMKLIDQIGYAHAMHLLLSGKLIDGRKAERIGLVNEAVPGDSVIPIALQLAEQLACNSPVALAATKEAALAHRSVEYKMREAAEQALVAAVRASGHSQIGIEAFLARHTPLYPDAEDHAARRN